MASEEITQQRRRLDEILAHNAKLLIDSGLVDRALGGRELDPTITPMITRRSLPVDNAPDGTIVAIEFPTTDFGKNGNVRSGHPEVSIVQTIGETSIVGDRFTEADRDLAESIIANLEMERDFGELPNLTGNLTGINDPSAMITRQPRSPQA